MWFKKKRPDVVDLVPLEKVRKRLEEKKSQQAPSQESIATTDIFSSFSSAAENQSSTTSSDSYFSSQESSLSENVKLQQIEERIDNLSRRISSVMDRLDLIEKKVRRLEGR